jgi:hypothetical protein
MKKKTSVDDYEMLPHYDLDPSKARPNRFAERFKDRIVTMVVLDPDVAEVFDSSESVNKILRSVITALPKRQPQRRVTKTQKKKAS